MKQKIEEKTPLKVLYLEDSPKDVEIIRELLLEAGYDLSLDFTDKKKEFTSLLRKNQYDIILSDFKLPGFDAFGALELHNEICPDVPFICVSGSIGEETAIELMMKGAVDYVLKDRLVRLPSAIKRVLNEVKEKNLLAKVEEELQENQKRFSSIFNASPIGTTITRISDGQIIEANPAITTILGYPHDELIGRTTTEINVWVNIEQRDTMLKILREKGSVHDFETRGRRKSGEIIDLLVSAEIIELSGTKCMLVLFFDITGRKRTEEELKKSEEKYRNLIENMSDGIFISDEKGTIQFVNKELARIHGYESPGKMIGKKFIEFIDPLLREEIEQNISNKVHTDNYSATQNIKIQKLDGSIAFVNIRPSPVFDGKRFIGNTGIVQDVTERKKAEDALRESEKNYRELIDGMNETVWIIDFNGDLIDVNKTAVKVLGYSKEELTTIGLFGIDSSLKKENIQTLAKSMQEDKLQIFETTHRAKDGRIFPVEVYSSIVTYQGKKSILSIARDITERKQADEALKVSESFLNSIIDQSPYPMWISDDKGTLIRINKACLELLNIKKNEVMGKYNVLGDNIVKEQGLLPLVNSVFEKGETAHFEIKYDTSKLNSLKVKQKISVILDTTIFPIKNMSGEVTNAVIQHVDITEHKQMEEQMRQMQKLEGLGTLAGGIAHDFNNILGIILAYNTGIKRFKNDEKKLNLATETITKAVDRGKTLVQQILTFARKTETAFGAVNVIDIVMEIMTMILETFPKTLTYTQNFEKGLPFINADRTQLYQALLNLCVNARDAMPNGGLLTINTRMVAGADLIAKHPGVMDNNYICIEVSDTGEGMTDEVKKRIFEPFFTTKGIGKGTGLGLAVVFGVIQTHKGFVDVESEIGKGTTFKLYLPALKAEAPIIEIEEEKLEEIRGGTETLLVVEDEEMLIMSLQMLLVEKGYNVIPTRDGLEALKIYQENKKDIALVLTDLGLPTISGLEVCQRIRKIKSNERVILATGYLDPEMKADLQKAGIQNFLYKPYEMIKVLKVIREVLDGK